MENILLIFLSIGASLASRCQHREPLGLTGTHKVTGDSGFYIELSGSPETYQPMATYTLSLSGDRADDSTKAFTQFVLVAENVDTQRLNTDSGSSGDFQLLGDVHTRFSDHCTNTVTESSRVPKADIQVLWTAPPSGSGCVHFKAMVVEEERRWSMDDSRLTLTVCEKRTEEEETNVINSPCCACEEAKYEVMFQGLWSKETHPRDFPASEWLLHFSDVIGASHSDDYRVWEKGAIASKGLEQVAKWGSPRLLESELKASSSHIRTIIKARGLWHPNVLGKTFAIFRTDPANHLVSLVSMLGPSPDWVVGVSALELCMANCTWLDRKELLLYPWDVGVDEGISYESPDSPSSPFRPIKRITSKDPDDPMSPFYRSSGEPFPPLAKLTVQKLREYKKSCSLDSSLGAPLQWEEPLPETDPSPACRLHPWAEWSGCSVSCGKGISMRKRIYRDPVEASRASCDQQLVQKEMCASDTPVCPGSSTFYSSAPSDWMPDDTCATTEWSSWSPCSVACGRGFRARTRRFFDRMGRKKCPHMDTVTQEECQGGRACAPGENEPEYVRPECSVTDWSLWSPCSASCGQGLKVRTRLYRVSREEQIEAGCSLQLLQNAACSGASDCESSSSCSLPREAGPCRGAFRRWYFDSKTGQCLEFFFGGCRGNSNNFMKEEDCRKVCMDDSIGRAHKEDTSVFLNDGFNSALDVLVRDRAEKRSEGQTEAFIQVEELRGAVRELEEEAAQAQNDGKVFVKEGELRATQKKLMMMEKTMMMEKQMMMFKQKQMMMAKQREMMKKKPHQLQTLVAKPSNISLLDGNQDCVLTAWSPWSHQCSHSCGPQGVRHRFRTISVAPQGKGAPCPTRLERRRRCRLPPCPAHCQAGAWESWGACSASCGPGGVQSRRRGPGTCPHQGGEGEEEEGALETRVCRLPCCPSQPHCY